MVYKKLTWGCRHAPSIMAQCIRILIMPTTTGDKFRSGARLFGLALGWPSTWPVMVRSALQGGEKERSPSVRRLDAAHIVFIQLKIIMVILNEGFTALKYCLESKENTHNTIFCCILRIHNTNYSQVPYLWASVFPWERDPLPPIWTLHSGQTFTSTGRPHYNIYIYDFLVQHSSIYIQCLQRNWQWLKLVNWLHWLRTVGIAANFTWNRGLSQTVLATMKTKNYFCKSMYTMSKYVRFLVADDHWRQFFRSERAEADKVVLSKCCWPKDSETTLLNKRWLPLTFPM